MATFTLRVDKRVQETDDTVSLLFRVPGDLRTTFGYRPGQFVAVEDDPAGEMISRQYSLSSVPDADPYLRITVKRVPDGAMSTFLVDRVDEGDLLEVAPPRGRLYVPTDEPRHYLMLAAGSGVAPLVAIARHVLDRDLDDRVSFVYGNRTEDSIILREEVDGLAADPRAHVEHVLSRAGEDWAGRHGRVDADLLAALWDSLAGPRPMSVFLCGPEEFMSAAEEFLVARGVDLNDIRKESFDLVLNDDADADGSDDLVVPGTGGDGADPGSARIVAVVGGEEYEADTEPDEPLLSALLRHDADVPFSCQEGTCASCIVKLADGRVRVRPGVLETLRPDDLEEGLVLACLSRPMSEHVRIDFDDI
ncbi:3-ketosteroid-9-alpha-monooxygenase, ferredoxin reductase component [Actinomycetospora sp. NBRC 106375]|uniref:ferredoxin--NADP reductase n=1 Tax=Actinomycetospora sp. NBRC 106375 TaxID=3032207 RepID=UPI0024A1F227|nr:ferredoxin--NADP reductase [Actinomycetospora sp. NBRC 106375]GLZ50134.1 3-ketosteroid-9-alpha-monooxygenase, ferredoxin reductase component [Actinomycetospora sp. NBRC 106375]